MAIPSVPKEYQDALNKEIEEKIAKPIFDQYKWSNIDEDCNFIAKKNIMIRHNRDMMDAINHTIEQVGNLIMREVRTMREKMK